MDLYVLRHGLAAARGSVEYPYDADRPLTPKGTRRMVRQARGLNALGLSLDVILTSPLVRALETAEIVHRELDSPGRLVESEALAPMGHPAKLIDQLAMDYPSAGNVMIVGQMLDEQLCKVLVVLPGVIMRWRSYGLPVGTDIRPGQSQG